MKINKKREGISMRLLKRLSLTFATVFVCWLPMQAQAVSGDVVTVAAAGNLNVPKGIAFDAAGNTYVADSATNKVTKVSSAGVQTVIAGTGLTGNTGDGLLATAATFSNPWDVAVDTNGDVYIVDRANNNVRVVTAATGIISTVVGGTQAAFTTTLAGPSALAIHAGKLYIVDSNNHRIVIYNLTTGFVTVAVNGIANPAGFGGDGGFAILASLNAPADISFDPYGNYYIADTGNSRIRKVDVAGTISTVAGSGVVPTGTTPAGDWDVATNVALNPLGVAADVYGNVYFTDDHGFGFGYQRLVQMFADGTMVTVSGVEFSQFPGGGTAGVAALGTNAAASKLPLLGLSDIEVGVNGEVYFVESQPNALRKLTPDNIAPTGVSLAIRRQANPIFGTPSIVVTNSPNISLESVCTDYSMCDQMQFSNDGSTWNPWVNYAQIYVQFFAGTSYHVPYTLPAGDGVKTVHARFKDRAGNVSAPINRTVTLDTTAPAVPVITTPIADSYVNTWANSVIGTAEANASISLFVNGSRFPSAIFNAAGDGSWSSAIGLNQNTTTTFQVQATDVAGNISALSVATSVTYDASPPVINGIPSSTVIVEYGTPYVAPNITVSDNVDIGLVPTITGSAVDVYALGYYLQTYSAQDRAGNVAQRQFQVQVVDTVAPVITVPADITVTATDSLGIGSNSTAALSSFLNGAIANDNVDGVLNASYSAPAIFSVGPNTVTFTATDYSNNTSSATAIVTVLPATTGGSGGGTAGDSGGGGGCLIPSSSPIGLLPMLSLLMMGIIFSRRKGLFD